MAEKSFGVKEVNLIGASGTPTITSPNNLNLNAVNVAISTNVSIGGTLTVSGSLSIGGTITYEDVTNVDSVGVVTARNGLNVSGGNVTIAKDIDVDGHTELDNVNISGVSTFGNNITASGTSRFEIASMENGVLDGEISHNGDATTKIKFETSVIKLDTAGTTRINVNNSGATVTGTLSATTFSGSGASLTGVAVTEAPVTDYTITANGSSAYRFHGGGVDETADDPDLYLVRGQKYRFNNTTGSSHPFAIREASGGSAYSNGVTGSNQGVQFFTVPYDAPSSLFYQCTIHSGMVGNIYIRGAAGQNTNVGITTFTGMAFFRNDLTVSSSGLAVNIFESTDNHSRLRIKSADASLAQLEFADQSDADAGEIRYDHGNDRMTFHVGNNAEKLRINSTGELHISDRNSSNTGDHFFQAGAFGIRMEDTGGFNRWNIERNYGGFQSTPIVHLSAQPRVGINTTSPDTTLSVDGSINVTKGIYGKLYTGATTIDTGIMVGELSNFSHGVLEVIVSGNQNHFGSGYYRGSSTYMVHISTGWTGSALSTRIRSTRISYGDGGSSNNQEVTATFHLYDATTDTESNSGAARDNNDQLRIKIVGTSTASGIQCFVKVLSNAQYLS